VVYCCGFEVASNVSYCLPISAKVLRGFEPNLFNEVIRVIMSSPQWTPGRMGLKYVRQQFVFPINCPAY
jgi:hypothetical protein